MRRRRGLKAQMRDWNHMTRQMRAEAERARWHHSMGRRFKITARFPNTDDGVTAVNDWLAKNPGHGVITTTRAEILTAALADEGEPLPALRKGT